MLRSLLRPVGRWLAGPNPSPGWLLLRVWLVLGLMTPALGLGGWVRPSAIEHTPVAQLGLHAAPLAHGDLAERTQELPLTNEAEAKDAAGAEDALRERASTALAWLDRSFDLSLAAAVSQHRFADAHDGGSGSSHRSTLHNRGPPVA